MEMKKILWPTDFSGNAGKALPYVTSLGEKYQAEVHVLYVIEELAHHEPWYGEFDRAHIEKIRKWEEREARKRLDEICENYLFRFSDFKRGCQGNRARPHWISLSAIHGPDGLQSLGALCC